MTTSTPQAASDPCEWCGQPTETPTAGTPAGLCPRCLIVQAEDKRTWDQPEGTYAWLERSASGW